MKQLNIGKLAIARVLSLGRSAAEGIHREVNLDLKYITEAMLREKYALANQKNSDFQGKVSDVAAAQKALNEVFAQALAFVQVARDNFKPELGSQYSLAWNAVGFIHDTLRLPRSVVNAMGLIEAMELFLHAHPEMVVPQTVTPELAAQTYNSLKVACAVVTNATVAMRQQKLERDEALADLRRTLMLLRRELSMLLVDDDPRWLLFGFNVPADNSVPQAPEGLTVTSDAPGQARLSWGRPTNTDRFHVWQQTVGIDAEPARVATVTDTSKTVTGLTAGAQVRFYITALSAAGESVPSEIVEVLVL